MADQNKVTTSTAQNFLTGGDFSEVLPTPDKARFAYWSAAPPLVASPGDWVQVGDNYTEGDGGVTGSKLQPDANNGARLQFDSTGNQERNYKGQTFAWTGRDTTFRARCGFGFQSETDCHTDDYIGLYNGNATFNAGFNFIGFRILQNVDGFPLQYYHAQIQVNGDIIYDVPTAIQVDVVPASEYPTVPTIHDFEVRMQNGGQNILFLIDKKVVASYDVNSGTPQQWIACLFYYHSSIDSTTGHMISQAEYMYLENETV